MQGYTKTQLNLFAEIEKLRVKREMMREQLALTSRSIRSLRAKLAHSIKVSNN